MGVWESGRKIDPATGETRGAREETQENKKIFVPLSKKDTNIKSHELWK